MQLLNRRQLANRAPSRSQLRPGEIIAFCGLLGSGKTLSMTMIGYMEHLRGIPVYANYDTQFAARLENLPQMFRLTNCLLLIDEFQVLLDSRTFAKQEQLLMSYWLLLIRKLGITLLYTTQHINQVELRLRQITTYVFWCFPGDGYSLIDILRYGGADSASLVSRVTLPHDGLYGLYATRDPRVKLSPDEGGKAECPFPHLADPSLVGSSVGSSVVSSPRPDERAAPAGRERRSVVPTKKGGR